MLDDWLKSVPDTEARVKADPVLFSSLASVWEWSEYARQSFMRDRGLLPTLIASGDLRKTHATEEFAKRLLTRLNGVKEETALHRELRLFRRYEMVRIIWRDLTGWAPLAETLEDLSALAEVCIQQALELLYAWATTKQGMPSDEAGVQQQLLVLGMGKLGARELNLSSDIDLIFVYPSHGHVAGGRHLTNEQFFTRLSQQLIKALGSQTVDGFVFRVDTRLRPFGESGPLVISFEALENYYQSHGREWERYALIKARLVAGDAQSGAKLEAMLRPFVYRRYLDFSAFESLRDMKQLISRDLQRKGMADNIKLGPGGIREIEFIGQVFQLIRGGRDPDLRLRPILLVLDQLQAKKLLPDQTVSDLSQAYRFLRLVENRLQAWQDRQTHLLPENAQGRLRLARSMGFDTWDLFFEWLEQHRKSVQGHFDMVFAPSQADDKGDENQLIAVWLQQIDQNQSKDALEQAGFKDGVTTLGMLDTFRDSHTCRVLSTIGRERLDQLMPLLLEAVANRAAEAELTLERLLKLLVAIAGRTTYLSLLLEHPTALIQLVRLTEVSPWIANRVARHPLLLDEMLDPRRLFTPLRRENLELELDSLLAAIDEADLEQQMECLRQFSQSNMLRVAAADITDVIPLMVVSDYLTDIAETVITRILEQAWRDMTQRYGRPTHLAAEEKGFVIIGYGKLGGIELGYRSDLDMVFLHNNKDQYAMTDGKKSILTDLFYMRLGQRMIHMLSTRTPSGLLYEVDMRLRPNGNSGILVSSLAVFENYQQNSAWTWEHQALLRARPVAGDPKVIELFHRIRHEVLTQQLDTNKLRHDVVNMRTKMRKSLDKSAEGKFDIKQGHGGIADIEFMVQYTVLRWANRYPDLLRWTDNVRLIDTLASHGILDAAQAEQLAGCYRTLRARVHRKALNEKPAFLSQSELEDERRLVQELWGSLLQEPAKSVERK